MGQFLSIFVVFNSVVTVRFLVCRAEHRFSFRYLLLSYFALLSRSFFRTLSLSPIYPSLRVFISISLYVSTYQSIYPSIYLSITPYLYLSIYLYLSVYLAV